MPTQQNIDITIQHTRSVYTITGFPIGELPKLFKALKECDGEEPRACKLYRESNERKNSEKKTTDIGIVLPVGAEKLQQFKTLAGIPV